MSLNLLGFLLILFISGCIVYFLYYLFSNFWLYITMAILIIFLIFLIVIFFKNFKNINFNSNISNNIKTRSNNKKTKSKKSLQINNYDGSKLIDIKYNKKQLKENRKNYKVSEMQKKFSSQHKFEKELSMEESEIYFYKILIKYFSQYYDIRVKFKLDLYINLSKDLKRKYKKELKRIIKFGIFEIKESIPILLIEISDINKLNNKQQNSNEKMRELCKQLNISFITFWTTMPKDEKYIFEVINNTLNKKDSNE